MNWTNKFENFRDEAVKELSKIAYKYNQEEIWNNRTENDDWLDLSKEIYCEDSFYENYTIVLFEDGQFLGYGWENNDELWFDIDDLETRTICQLIDLINEPD